ncbi:unnamed protein product [Symbiodinium pilosum]|uniref:Lipoxygenase domain-containing protein n=1 Tax=Symbiodinium pilosum TaxID=2952 RepID=A0A812UU67_SYMPI|nr:unnamed protein product [Symbiodinium pilosum]
MEAVLPTARRQDMQEMCPLYDSRITPWALWALGIIKRATGTMSMVSLWPSGVHPEDFADEYTASVMTIVGRILLGLYKTRDKSYVNVPTEMLYREDVLEVENIHAPHYDVDGNPNFYWFEAIVPKIVLRKLYVPLMTCFYSALRKLNVENSSMTGRFDDALDDPTHNTWDAVLKSGKFKSKRDWVMSFYNIAHTMDGNPLWPQQMTDFSVYFKKDEWDDQLERAIAFHLIGAHRLEVGSFSFEDVPGVGSVQLPFRIALNVFGGLVVRDGFGKYGVDLYFNEDGLPTLLVTPDGDKVARGDKQWQYWKFVWRSTLVTGVTLVDHLHFTHFRTGNLLSRSIRIALPPDHPHRRLLSIFTFGTIFVNIQAVHVLLGPNHLLHRATPFSDFVKLSHKVPGMLDDITDAPSIKAIAEDDEWKSLSPKLQSLPFYSDGRLLWAAIKKFVAAAFPKLSLCSADGALAEPLTRLKIEMVNETMQAGYHVDDRLAKMYLGDAAVSCKDLLPAVQHRMAVYIFVVTGYHRHVGFVGDYYADPSLASMSWKSGEPYGRPRQHMIMSVVNVFTSMRQPLLKEDYTHLFRGLAPDQEEILTKAWRTFQEDLKQVEEEIDRRNEKREILNINMSPKVVESAVSK